MPIEAICFDVDGVVVNPQMQFARLLDLNYGITPQMTKTFFNGIFNECLIGKAELLDVLLPFLQEWNWSGTAEEFVALWLKTDHVIDSDLIKTIINLRQSGVICCLATSQEQHRADYMKKEMGFKPLFDHMFVSCEIGAQKPDPAFYQYIEKYLELDAKSILFWDDRPQNVNAAKTHGWKAELYTDYEHFHETLSFYLL